MKRGDSAKKLLTAYNQEHYRAFMLDDKATLSLPAISSVPGIGASSHRREEYTKTTISPRGDKHQVKFIKKDGHANGFVWQTDAKQLKNAVRWGIVKTHSITGKVIASLGNYRVTAHKRVAKGMVSNSQTLKLRLLDLFQDRFEALQALESLVNKNNDLNQYETTLTSYIEKLQAIAADVDKYFSDINQPGFDKESIAQLKRGIEADIKRTRDYLALLKAKDDLSMVDTARAKDSILEFVKQQMIHGLYDLQAVNQDLTFSRRRRFALTRGELNDYIEDARKEIDDHQPDLRNAVTDKHHGLYGSPDSIVTYDFTDDHLTPAQERDVLLAISFIEGWDKVDIDGGVPRVTNKSGSETLDVIYATKWQTHRNFIAFIKSAGFYLINIIASIFVSTRPWEEETWKKKDKGEVKGFHLIAKELREHAKPNEPMWRKPVRFVKQVAYAAMDLFNGIRDFGAELTFRMPAAVINDWQSSYNPPTLKETLKKVNLILADIKMQEDERLRDVLSKVKDYKEPEQSKATSELAHAEYALSSNEQNDILTAMIRGVTGFGEVFSHNIYAKDPVGGLLFTAGFAIGAGAIYFPSLTTTMFGAAYTNWFANFSYTMGSSPMAAAIAGGGTQAEIFAAGWDGVIHGPSGMMMNALYRCGEDPLTVGAYCAAAYYLGYVLANGVGGHPIPWLSEHMIEDLGTVPESGYPIIGAKLAVLLYEAFIVEPEEHSHMPTLSVTEQELNSYPAKCDPNLIKKVDQLRLIVWLSINAKVLTKLDSDSLFAISQQIDHLFERGSQESKSLHKLLYPETKQSIAFQLLSIPLAYIPAILRFSASLVVTLAALVNGNPRPWEPVKRGGAHLFELAKKDLSRLLVFGTKLTYCLYILCTTFVKMTGNLISLAAGRIASLFDIKSAHFFHHLFAASHVFFRSIGEFLYPTRALKEVAVAHPIHTILDVEGSYKKMIKGVLHPQTEGKDDGLEGIVGVVEEGQGAAAAPVARPPEIIGRLTRSPNSAFSRPGGQRAVVPDLSLRAASV